MSHRRNRTDLQFQAHRPWLGSQDLSNALRSLTLSSLSWAVVDWVAFTDSNWLIFIVLAYRRNCRLRFLDAPRRATIQTSGRRRPIGGFAHFGGKYRVRP